MLSISGGFGYNTDIMNKKEGHTILKLILFAAVFFYVFAAMQRWEFAGNVDNDAYSAAISEFGNYPAWAAAFYSQWSGRLILHTVAVYLRHFVKKHKLRGIIIQL